MMFLCNMFNHNSLGQRSLEDVIGIFGNQLRSLGHEAVWRTKNDQFLQGDAGINIIVEGFTPSSIQIIHHYHQMGCRFLCLATEEPTPRGFNWGRDPEMVLRQKYFADAAQMFEGIFHLVPGEHITRWYGQWAPSAYIELGYADTLMRPGLKEPEYDFGFYGSMSTRRLRVLRRLARHTSKPNPIVTCTDFPTQAVRDETMRKAKVLLQIRKYDEMQLVSSSRCNTALSIGRPVVAEPHDLCEPWNKIVKFSDTTDSFYRDAIWALSHWRSMHEKQLIRFKALLNPRVCVGEPMEKIKLDLTPPKIKTHMTPNSTFPQKFLQSATNDDVKLPMTVSGR